MKKWICTGIAGLTVAAMLCGCGNGKSSSETETETSVETSESEVSSAEKLNNQVYAYDFDVKKLVTLGDYKGLTYTETDTSVSDTDVEDNINTTLNSYATPEQIKDRAVASGDTVNIDYVGKVDGKEFDGGTGTGYSLTIGSGTFIDGFEDGLVGHKPGEKVTLKLTFPKDYKETTLAGKAVEFTVTINYIEGDSVVPKLTDDFVKGLKISDVNTVAEYRAYIKKQLQSENESTAEQSKQQELIKEAVANSKIKDYPAELVKQYKDSYISYYEQYASYYGVSLADFLTSYGSYFGTSATTEKELDTEAEKYGKEATGNMLVICAIAKAEGYEVTDDIYKEKLKKYVEEYSFDSTDALESQYGKRYLKQIMINEEVISVLEKDAKGVKAETSESGAETSAETEVETLSK